MEQALTFARSGWNRFRRWLFKEEHKHAARQVREEVEVAFTAHPHETGETYLEHLGFTASMALRFVAVSGVMLTHGLFPFLLTRTASKQTEKIYGIMKGRISKVRRQELDANESDYCV